VLTAELDPALAGAAAAMFADDDQVEVVAADWTTLRDRGPFSLLFLDAREPKDSGADLIVDLVEPGGIVVLDDFTPCSSWPPVYEGRVDSLREQWLTDERFTTVEVMVAGDASVLIAAKR
jgi:predicted O-methyltransferase YrrM